MAGLAKDLVLLGIHRRGRSAPVLPPVPPPAMLCESLNVAHISDLPGYVFMPSPTPNPGFLVRRLKWGVRFCERGTTPHSKPPCIYVLCNTELEVWVAAERQIRIDVEELRVSAAK